ncbi:hypothetical protein HWV62_21338 [Athelia sp. TMB]|nr:hypothetical protein HWV62_21338 [Athelia sp. TMB]
MDLIERIRRENGCDQALLLRAQDDPDILAAIQALKGNAGRGLERLSDELYSRDTHFLLEFLQNADDNHYAPGIVPEVRLALNGREIRIECNESGFTEANVEAICKIGASTKKVATGYIGFKSVFKVADVVHISSGIYKFKLDRREELGMITPIWSPALVSKPDVTTFILELCKSAEADAISTHLNDIKPSLLLFLHKLRSVVTQGPSSVVEIRREDVDQDVVQLKRIENGAVTPEKYLLITRSTKTFTGESKRAQITQSDIVLAFPLEADESPKIGVQNVHAFLPLRSYGFTFVIQGDFLTSTSREDVLTDLKWNTALRDSIADSFVAALDKFKSRPSLEYTWIRFLPQGIVDPFFHPVQTSILEKLAQRPVLRTADGNYDLPNKFIVAIKSFCMPDGTPILPEAHLSDGLHYLPAAYNAEVDATHLARLGVAQMSADHFLRGLHLMQGHFSAQTPDWHEAMCQSLHMIPRLHNGGLRAEIQKLLLLPLSDNTWISGLSSNDVFFQSTLSDIPADLGLRLIATNILPHSWTYRLYSQLGIRESDSQRVANKILDLHRRSYSMPLQTLIRHAKFMFVHRHSTIFPSAAGLRLADEEERVGFGHDLYADITLAPQTVSMRGLLPSPARFIHTAYLEANDTDEWKKWLCNNVGVNTSPRLVHGQLSPEFNAMVQEVDTRALLIILKESWPKWSTKLTTSAYAKLAELPVLCGDGAKFKLKETFLKKETMATYAALPYLPIDDPDSLAWAFLSKLGVTTQVNGPFFLKRLRDLKNSPAPERAVAEEIYLQLQARFEDDAMGIRNAFRQDLLIFIPENDTAGRWVSTADVVWDGPISIKSKFVLKLAYPSLQKLFETRLAIPVAGPDMLVQELSTLANQYSGKNIALPVQNQIYEYLVDISDAIWAHPEKSSTWLAKLSKQAIFPVAKTEEETVLLSADDHFYIPDKTGRYQAIFANRVPLLRTNATCSIESIRPILECETFRTRLCNMDAFVSHVCVPEGSKEFESALSAKYIRVAHYIERLWQSNRRSKPTQEALQTLHQLRDVRIQTVDSIESTFTLDGVNVVDRDMLAIEQTPEHEGLCILISRASFSLAPDLCICGKLAEILGMDVHTLFNFASQPPETIEQLMKIQNIPEIALPPHNQYNDLLGGLENPESSDKDSNAAALSATNDQIEFDGSQLANGLHLILHNEAFCSIRDVLVLGPMVDDQSKATNSIDSTGLGATMDASEYIAKASESTAISARNNHPPIPLTGASGDAAVDTVPMQLKPLATEKLIASIASPKYQITGDHILNGVLGESFIYSTFLKELPGFGPENWTSEWRAHYPEMEPYDGPSLADFKYHDCEGVLTTVLYGEETKAAWASTWPTYHIEVKSTSRSQSEPFHLSRTQMEHVSVILGSNIYLVDFGAEQALHLSYRSTTIPPKDIYVIARVSQVRTTPAYSLYCDPHLLFYKGVLRVASSIEVSGIKGEPMEQTGLPE